MSGQAQTFKIAKIPADGVGREVVRPASGYSTTSPGSRAASWRSHGKSFRGDASTTTRPAA